MSKRRRSPGGRRGADERFWGPTAPEVATLPRVKPAAEPGGLVRSLGPPPLATDGAASQRYLAEVYESAVRAATALAAASGLLEEEEDAAP